MLFVSTMYYKKYFSVKVIHVAKVGQYFAKKVQLNYVPNHDIYEGKSLFILFVGVYVYYLRFCI